LPIDAPSQSAFLGNARRTVKKPAKYYLKIIDAAIPLRIAEWGKVHCCVTILAQATTYKINLKKETQQVIRRISPIQEDIAY
jgi:hypothetical protein